MPIADTPTSPDNDIIACPPIPVETLEWMTMLELACRHLGKFAIYGNYTAPVTTTEGADPLLDSYCTRFFAWTDKHGLERDYAERLLSPLLTGQAVLFKTSAEAGLIYRFFLESGMQNAAWYACFVSPTEGLIDENT